MLLVEIPEQEFYNEEKSVFFTTKKVNFQIEHSLVSLSKWESKWCKPFTGDKPKTDEEMRDYVRAMTISQNVPSEAYSYIPPKVMKQIENYINAPMTAMWFNDQKSKNSRDIVTAELIYYIMISHNIPIEPCQKWHLNRLIALIRVCNIKNSPKDKQNKKEMLANRAALNKARRAKYNTKG